MNLILTDYRTNTSMKTPEEKPVADMHQTIPAFDWHADVEESYDLMEVIDRRDTKQREDLVNELERVVDMAFKISLRLLVDDVIESTKTYHSELLSKEFAKHGLDESTLRGRLIRHIATKADGRKVSTHVFQMWFKRFCAPYTTGVELLNFDIALSNYLAEDYDDMIPCYPKQIGNFATMVKNWRSLHSLETVVTKERPSLTDQT